MTTSAQQRRTMSRALTRAANASVAEVLSTAEGSEGHCLRIGVTGPPGAGKSTLISSLVPHRLRSGGNVAVLAIDPTSPMSGGAILGDRIRMEELAHHPNVYIRSLASRMSHDGLADNLPDMLEIVERAGFAEAILETVGVGQVEYAVRHVADTIVLVLMPGAGDQIQAMKGGILETADIVAVNKSDLPGAQQLVSELKSILASPRHDWTPSIVQTSTRDAASIERLSAEIDRHQAWLAERQGATGKLEGRRAHHVSSLIIRRVGEVLQDLNAEDFRKPLGAIYDEVVRRLGDRCSVQIGRS